MHEGFFRMKTVAATRIVIYILFGQGFGFFSFLLTIAANGKKDGDDVKGGGKVDSFFPP